MSRETQRPWNPPKREPTGYFQTADVVMRSDRSLAGPLRMGTARGAGPTGAVLGGASDFEMDRITPRKYDPIGNSHERSPEFPKSSLLSRESRTKRG